MGDSERILELLIEWDERRQRGEDCSATALLVVAGVDAGLVCWLSTRVPTLTELLPASAAAWLALIPKFGSEQVKPVAELGVVLTQAGLLIAGAG